MSAIDPATKAHWRRVYDDRHAELWDGAQLGTPTDMHTPLGEPIDGSAVRLVGRAGARIVRPLPSSCSRHRLRCGRGPLSMGYGLVRRHRSEARGEERNVLGAAR